ncbi:MAG TPA: hypothetical protein VGM91_21375 [Conexibacter sp.]|jgi:hypothetical protein
MRRRGEEGQAANEYVALLAIVAVVFVALVGLTEGGIGSQVLDGMRRGICVVAPGPCPRPIPARDELRPCPVERESREDELSETIASVKIGSSGTLSEVRNSDGTVTVTLADGSALGVEWGVGGKVALGHAFGAEATAGASVTWGNGRSWNFPNEAEAQKFVDRYGDKATMTGKLVDEVRSRCSILCDAIGWRPHAELPEPDATNSEGGLVGTLSAAFGEHVDGNASALLGRRETREGDTTWYLKLSAGLTAKLRLPLPELTGAAGATGVLSYTIGKDGRPLRLSVDLAGEASGRATVRGTTSSRSASGNGAGRLAGGGFVEAEATLDLTDPSLKAVAGDVLDAIVERKPLELPGRVAALGDQLGQRAQIDLRVYTLDNNAKQFGGSLGLGVKVGGSFQRTAKNMRLVSAQTRLPGLPFLTRDDCRAA